MNSSPDDIIEFWFSDRVRTRWFSSTPVLDREILEKYEGIWAQASSGTLDDWTSEPVGCLALVIVLDQFPLNMFRGQAKSFRTEQQAIEVARQAIGNQLDRQIAREMRAFLYMPFMHSEDLADQDLSVRLYRENGLEANTEFAEHHRAIVRRFGRFPHRNRILGRESTAEELRWLESEHAFKG